MSCEYCNTDINNIASEELHNNSQASKGLSNNENRRENWYNNPGGNIYELNTFVSAARGPVWGPKNFLNTFSNIGLFKYVIIAVIICLIILFVYNKIKFK